jgi:hypothetical protein
LPNNNEICYSFILQKILQLKRPIETGATSTGITTPACTCERLGQAKVVHALLGVQAKQRGVGAPTCLPGGRAAGPTLLIMLAAGPAGRPCRSVAPAHSISAGRNGGQDRKAAGVSCSGTGGYRVDARSDPPVVMLMHRCTQPCKPLLLHAASYGSRSSCYSSRVHRPAAQEQQWTTTTTSRSCAPSDRLACCAGASSVSGSSSTREQG